MESKLIRAAKLNDIELVRLLLTTREKVNYQEKESLKTALHYALQMEHIIVAKLLLKHGARTDIADCNGSSPMSHVLFKEIMDDENDVVSKEADSKKESKQAILSIFS